MEQCGFSCLSCAGEACEFETGSNPPECVQELITPTIHDEVHARYAEPENHRIMKAAVQTSERCSNLTRVQETMEFAHRIGAHRIGIATCTMLVEESRTLRKLLERAGFEVFGIACKVESNHRDDLDLVLEDGKRGAVLCNPLMQARLLEEEHTDLNIVMGLCVGHDTLFYRYSHAPVTTLVTKDHITGNNACAGLYASKSIYKKRLNATIEGCRTGTFA
ncbi:MULTISPECIES: DUF1847 domain-containing protein [Gordonibacter]|uniref:DUF1847 domain-containing protein n=1 Tax=Gordonibacter faecis TaxID=3047475 RepID=A0ABT7DTY9_9ACTN|nr:MULTISPECIES: DUF1847 domain-containing protein [unclassified Gordonibacter]MDJ1651590.1 DUF1847 domain-containing protein [Gordonibacter sp. KGMB12511]HIW77012.1 DUF1847 domain-containing protein [Candidatus Gordonibacter avicola]